MPASATRWTRQPSSRDTLVLVVYRSRHPHVHLSRAQLQEPRLQLRIGVCLNWRLVSVPFPPNRPMNPLEFQNLAVGLPFRRPRRHNIGKRLLKCEPRIINLVVQRPHRFAAERDGFEPRRERHLAVLLRIVDHLHEQRPNQTRHVHSVELEQHQRRTALHHLPQLRRRYLDRSERKVVERAARACEEREEALVAPARRHVARVPHPREQLKVAQDRRRERVEQVADAHLVAADRDEHERDQARHRDARALVLCLAPVLRDLDMEVREQRRTRQDVEQLLDLGRAVAPAQRQVREVRPGQRAVAVGHRARGDLQLPEPGEELGAEGRPRRALRRDLELLERRQRTAHERVEAVPVARRGGKVYKDGAPAVRIVADDVAQPAQGARGDVVAQKVVPEPERDGDGARALDPRVQDLFLCVEHPRGGQIEVEGCPQPGHGEGQRAPAAAHAAQEERCAPAGLAMWAAHVDIAAKVEHAGHDLWWHPLDR